MKKRLTLTSMSRRHYGDNIRYLNNTFNHSSRNGRGGLTMDIKEIAAFFLGLACGMLSEVVLVLLIQLYEILEQKFNGRRK